MLRLYVWLRRVCVCMCTCAWGVMANVKLTQTQTGSHFYICSLCVNFVGLELIFDTYHSIIVILFNLVNLIVTIFLFKNMKIFASHIHL